MIMIGVTGANTTTLISEVSEWLKLPEEPSGLPASEVKIEADPIGSRSLFEYIGIGVVLVAIGYAIFGNKLKSKSSEQFQEADSC